jgi:phosphoribulokinase
MSKRVDHPIILGIVGDSASGKTTLTAGVAQILGEERCTVICTDDYHRFDRRERAAKGMSAIDPRANYLDILEQALRHLREGDPILKPVYDHRDGSFGRPAYVKPKEFVIAEGLLGYTTRAMRDCYDVKIYLDPDEDLRVKWKLHRDTTTRGYRREEVLASLERRREDSSKYMHPQRTFADIVIRF